MSNRVKEIVSLTLTLGWKNKKQPSGPTELDLEAGNLVKFKLLMDLLSFCFDIMCNSSKIE